MANHSPLNPDLIRQMASDPEIRRLRRELFERVSRYRYSYNFEWLGRPIIQFPEDLIALQEIVWETRPDLIIETGIAHGGSLIFYASLLHLLGGDGLVAGIDIEIRPHNRQAIEAHPYFNRIRLIEGSSIDSGVRDAVALLARDRKRVMVVLDSNHTGDHVSRELELYSPLVTPGCYLVILDTVIEQMPPEFSADRPWEPGNSPATAATAFLEKNRDFENASLIDGKLLLSVAPGGYLRRGPETTR
jgi:cephalosporin hydroxylase